MANTLDATYPELWSSLLQVPLRKSLVGIESVCDTSFEADLKFGDTVHFPYHSDLSVGTYTPGTDVIVSDVTATDEYLTVNQKKYVAFYIDRFEEIQSRYDLIAAFSDEAAYRMRDVIDTAIFAEVANAASALDAGDVGGTSGSGISATTANIIQVFTAARKKLRTMNVEEAADWIAVISPNVAAVIEETATGKGFQIADATLRNGYAGDFLGFKVYVTNNLSTATYGGRTCELAYFGKAKSIHLVMQMPPRVEIKEEPKKDGRNILTFALYGLKTFTKNSYRFLKVYFLVPSS
jgi:hypothetical protein